MTRLDMMAPPQATMIHMFLQRHLEGAGTGRPAAADPVQASFGQKGNMGHTHHPALSVKVVLDPITVSALHRGNSMLLRVLEAEEQTIRRRDLAHLPVMVLGIE